MIRRSIWWIACCLVFGGAPMVHGDDRALLQGWGAKPNLLLILDSGSSMTHDLASSSLIFVANADDDGRFADFLEQWYGPANLEILLGADYRRMLESGAKLQQAKQALSTLLDEAPGINFGFTTFAQADLQIAYLSFVYRVATGQAPMLDGSVAGDVLRLGGATNAAGASDPRAMLPIRFAEDGRSVFVANPDPFATNHGATEDPWPGDLRLASYLVDAENPFRARFWAELDLEQRRQGRLFYHPAFDVNAVDPSTRIVEGLTGAMSWQSVAPFLGVDGARPGWQELVREAVLAELGEHQIGSETLYVLERYEVFAGDEGWRAAALEDCAECDPPHVTQIEYVQHFVLHDHEPSEDGLGPSTLSAVVFAPGSDCGGYVHEEPWSQPLVASSRPDPETGETRDQRRRIGSYLGPQTASVFYVPTHGGSAFLPAWREHSLPGTETVVACGRRSLAESLRQAAEYFSNVVGSWQDPLAACRENLVVVMTDGGDSCDSAVSACLRAAELAPVPVFLVLLGDEQAFDDEVLADLQCVASAAGGAVSFVDQPEEMLAALRTVTRRVEEGRRSFGAMLLPSVRADAHQMAYVTSFTPVRGRSIWSGSLRAYPVDPVIGRPAVTGDGRLDPELAIWDAGEALARRWDWGDVFVANPFGTAGDSRTIYFAADAGRALLAYPGNAAERFSLRRELGLRLFADWPSTPQEESTDRLTELRFVIDFIRGVSESPDATGGRIEVRARDLYGWRDESGEEVIGIEKLGDPFHGKPERMAAPSCLPCFSSNYRDYREFFAKHRHRRSVLFVGANDGLMHAFDSGLWDADGFEGGAARYDVGTGRELFAWAPTSVMRHMPRMAGEPVHQWTVDGTATVADVWVDEVDE